MNEKTFIVNERKTECNQSDTKGRYGFDTEYNKSLPPEHSIIKKPN